MFCKNCGNQINENQVVCLNCGCKIGYGRKYCAHCGEELMQNAFACMKCGVSADFGSKENKSEIMKIEQNKQAIITALGLIMIIAGIIIILDLG